MRVLRVVHYGLAVVLALAVACSDERQTPTAPEAVVHLSFQIETTGSLTVQKAKLTLDGREVATARVPAGSARLEFDVAVPSVARGSHTVSIIVLEQTSSPTWYIASGAVTTRDRVLDMALVEGVIATGEGLTFHTTF